MAKQTPAWAHARPPMPHCVQYAVRLQPPHLEPPHFHCLSPWLRGFGPHLQPPVLHFVNRMSPAPARCVVEPYAEAGYAAKAAAESDGAADESIGAV